MYSVMSPFLRNFRDIIEHLDCLGKEFTKYFPGINTEDALIAMARNPFKCVVETIPEDIQVEFLQLVHDSFAKDEFKIISLSDFWAKMHLVYPNVSKRALKIIIPFSSTYPISPILRLVNKCKNRIKLNYLFTITNIVLPKNVLSHSILYTKAMVRASCTCQNFEVVTCQNSGSCHMSEWIFVILSLVRMDICNIVTCQNGYL